VPILSRIRVQSAEAREEKGRALVTAGPGGRSSPAKNLARWSPVSSPPGKEITETDRPDQMWVYNPSHARGLCCLPQPIHLFGFHSYWAGLDWIHKGYVWLPAWHLNQASQCRLRLFRCPTTPGAWPSWLKNQPRGTQKIQAIFFK
jgi:hypothetical protein